MKNMRKLVAVILAVVCLCACVAAAETVQSPTKPTAVVTVVVPTVTVEGEDVVPFTVEVVETEMWSEEAVQEYEEITQILADPEVVPTAIFTEEEMAAVATFVPEEFNTEELVIAEYIPLNINNYVPEIGDAAVQLALPGEYTEEDVIVAMFKPFGGDESTWIPLEAKLAVVEETETAEAEAAETEAAAETAETEAAAE